MACWLVKEEPDHYPYADFLAEGRTDWTGVRNYAARKHLRAMRPGDRVLYYHTGKERRVVGTARVSKAAFPDPTAPGEDWSAVELEAGRALEETVPLAALKSEACFAGSPLLAQGRLSVVPLETSQYRRILELGGLSEASR